MDVIEITNAVGDYMNGIYVKKPSKKGVNMFKLFESKISLFKKISDLEKNNTLWKNKAEEKDLEIKHLQMDFDYSERESNLKIEEAKNTIRKEMQKSLVEADVKLADARGKLTAYDELMIKREEFMELFNSVLTVITDRPDIKVLKTE